MHPSNKYGYVYQSPAWYTARQIATPSHIPAPC